MDVQPARTEWSLSRHVRGSSLKYSVSSSSSPASSSQGNVGMLETLKPALLAADTADSASAAAMSSLAMDSRRSTPSGTAILVAPSPLFSPFFSPFFSSPDCTDNKPFSMSKSSFCPLAPSSPRSPSSPAFFASISRRSSSEGKSGCDLSASSSDWYSLCSSSSSMRWNTRFSARSYSPLPNSGSASISLGMCRPQNLATSFPPCPSKTPNIFTSLFPPSSRRQTCSSSMFFRHPCMAQAPYTMVPPGSAPSSLCFSVFGVLR
mmetsp:Transcript_44971/g.140853  ORF Transcript_44971/g.140853 Transcript_44971/m.140853 type:complete len:263 (-) Transcript_44971:176-964(-)